MRSQHAKSSQWMLNYGFYRRLIFNPGFHACKDKKDQKREKSR